MNNYQNQINNICSNNDGTVTNSSLYQLNFILDKYASLEQHEQNYKFTEDFKKFVNDNFTGQYNLNEHVQKLLYSDRNDINQIINGIKYLETVYNYQILDQTKLNGSNSIKIEDIINQEIYNIYQKIKSLDYDLIEKEKKIYGKIIKETNKIINNQDEEINRLNHKIEEIQKMNILKIEKNIKIILNKIKLIICGFKFCLCSSICSFFTFLGTIFLATSKYKWGIWLTVPAIVLTLISPICKYYSNRSIKIEDNINNINHII